MTNLNAKHLKLIASANGLTKGAPLGLYTQEANELIAAGILETREVFTTGGNRGLRLFPKAA